MWDFHGRVSYTRKSVLCPPSYTPESGWGGDHGEHGVNPYRGWCPPQTLEVETAVDRPGRAGIVPTMADKLITVKFTEQELQLLRDYWAGDVEAMGDNARDMQPIGQAAHAKMCYALEQYLLKKKPL